MAIVEFETEELPAEQTNILAGNVVIQGAPLLTWWQRQSRQLTDRIMDQLRISMENGESTQQATTRIVGGTVAGVRQPGVMRTARHQAEAIVRTAMNEIVTQTRLGTLQEMDDVVKGLQQISTLDNRTSDICIAYSGKVWDVNTFEPIGHNLPWNGGTPRHFNCRSSIVPVLKSFEELGIDAVEVPQAARASMDGEVPAEITFDQWLRTKSKTFQDDLLGPGKAKLWREGKINLTQLVDMRGNPLTLEQLEARVRAN